MATRRRVTTSMRVRIFDAADGKCHICGLEIDVRKETWEADHVVALWRGGEDAEDNLRPAHSQCHKAKTILDLKARTKGMRIRASHIGAKVRGRGWRKLPFGRDSKFKRKMNGKVVRR